MSQENLDIAGAAFETWNAQDMDAYAELLDPDVVMRGPGDWPEPGPFVGRTAVLHQFQQIRETFDADRFEVLGDLIDVGDRVLVHANWHPVGRGPDQHMEMTTMYVIRNGKILTIDIFRDHAAALEAVGLSE